MMRETPDNQRGDKIAISLYEFYAMGVNTLIAKAPWELAGERVSAYHESFLYEQRLIALSVLFLLGEEYVPATVLRTMPGKYRDQVRHSVNLAVFTRALKHHYRQLASGNEVAEQMTRRMEAYIDIMRQAAHQNNDPLKAITMLLAKRVPPQTEQQLQLYQDRIDKIFEFTEQLTKRSLSEKYTITEL